MTAASSPQEAGAPQVPIDELADGMRYAIRLKYGDGPAEKPDGAWPVPFGAVSVLRILDALASREAEVRQAVAEERLRIADWMGECAENARYGIHDEDREAVWNLARALRRGES